MMKRVMITGANVGLGMECARQLAMLDDVQLVLLACRNEARARDARTELQQQTGKTDKFEIVLLDTSDSASIRAAVQSLDAPIDGLVLNAGGSGGPTPDALSGFGATMIASVNTVGHVLLVTLLLECDKLNGTVVYAGSEAIRGVPSLNMPIVPLKDGSVEEFVSILDGSFYEGKLSFENTYGHVKLIGALWMSKMARDRTTVRFVTISPGATSGTAVAKDLPFGKRMMFAIGIPIMRLFGMFHDLSTGGKRYVDALLDKDTFQSGIFYASKKGVSGAVGDQTELYPILKDTAYQDHASEALAKFAK